ARPRHDGVLAGSRSLALRPFPYVAEPRRAADEPRQPAGEGAMMFGHIERPAGTPSRTSIMSDFGLLYASNGFIGWLFAVTAPVAIILTVRSNRWLVTRPIRPLAFGA